MSEVSQAFESLIEAGREAFKWFGSLTAFTEEMKEMGLHLYRGFQPLTQKGMGWTGSGERWGDGSLNVN
jgi:hypothetical protein